MAGHRPSGLERIVFHIGTHKTGTTAIQLSLRSLREPLLERGVSYPEAGRNGGGHAQFGIELAQSDGPVADLPAHRALLDEVAVTRPATVVVSSESLTRSADGRSAEWARAVCAALEPRRTLVVAYVRPQWELLESRYAQRVKAGTTWVPFDRYLAGQLRHGDGLRYPVLLGPWRAAFDGGLCVRPYSRELLIRRDVVADFWQTAGLGAPPPPRRDSNPRLGPRATEMLRLLRATLAERGIDDRSRVAVAMQGASRRLAAELPDDRPFSALGPEGVARVAEHFAASNEEFVRTFMGGRHAGLFEPPSEVPEPEAWTLEAASARERRVFESLVSEALGERRRRPLLRRSVRAR